MKKAMLIIALSLFASLVLFARPALAGSGVNNQSDSNSASNQSSNTVSNQSPKNVSNFLPACESNIANATAVCNDVNNQIAGGTASNPIIRLIKDAINIMSFVVGAAAVIIIIISGFRFVTAAGDSSAVSGARSGLLAALIGVFIVILAQSIVIFVLDHIK